MDWNKFIIGWLTGTFLVTVVAVDLGLGIPRGYLINVGQQYSFLAGAFLRGSPAFLDFPGSFVDIVYFGGRMYWHMGPLPAMLLVPGVWLFSFFGTFFFQGFLAAFLNALVWVMGYLLARIAGIRKYDSWWLAFAFCFASVYQQVMLNPSTWYLAHGVTVFFGLAALLEFFSPTRRWWWMGMAMSLVFATRATAGLGLVFFLVAIWGGSYKCRVKVRQTIEFLAPMVIVMVVLAGYNQVRFGSFEETGYTMTGNLTQQKYELKTYGLFKLENIPTNFYYYFINTVEPVRQEMKTAFGRTHVLRYPYVKVKNPGVSFFVLSPVFALIFLADRRKKVVRYGWLVMSCIMFALMTYYWHGWVQVGARYMLDLMPFAYILLLYVFGERKLTRGVKLLIVLSSVWDLALYMTVWGGRG